MMSGSSMKHKRIFGVRQTIRIALFAFVLLLFAACSFSSNYTSSSSATPKPTPSPVPNCKLYLKIDFEANLIFSTYNVELYLDDEYISTMPHGQFFAKELDVKAGKHVLTFKEENGINSNTTDFTIKTDSTFSCRIKCHNSTISVSREELTDTILRAPSSTPDAEGLQDSSIALIDVTYMSLPDAMDALENIGLNNIREEPYADIWLKENWIVVSQSSEPGSIVDENDLIQLNCIKIDSYFKENYPGKTLAEIQEFSSAHGLSLKYRNTVDESDLDNTINALQDDNKQYWVVDKAEQWTGKTALVYLTYLGTPEERAEAEARAAEEKEKAEAKAKLEKELQSYLPKEDAKKAIIVAFTNECASDVFTADGNNYDPSKFHGYNYSGQFKQAVSKDGTWSAVDEKTWHVDKIYLYVKAYDHATKLSCDITFDGTNYVISKVDYMTAASKYIDSEDKSKTSGWMHMEPNDFNKFLTIPRSLVKENGGQNVDNAPPPPISSSTNSDYANWVGEQFSWWDGSHIELTKLIKNRLNDEKSYKHIKTEYYEMTSQDLVDAFNKALAESGYSDRLELNDLLIMTEFSAKNAYNATIKATAIGISSYKTNRVKLVGIE